VRAFRQHLHEDGDAYHWWNFVLKSNEKWDREEVKRVFKERYNEADNSDDSYGITNEILALTQSEGETIQNYLQMVERFSKRVPERYQNILAVQVIKGLRNETKRDQVSFALRSSKACTVKMVMDTIKDVFRQVGEPDPFAPSATEGKTRNRAKSIMIPSLSGVGHYGYDRQPQSQGIAVHAVRADPAAIMERPSTSAGQVPGAGLTQVQLQQMWEFFHRQSGGGNQQQDFRGPARNPNVIQPAFTGSYGAGRGAVGNRNPKEMFDSSHVTCFRCGAHSPNEHYASECDPANVPLSVERQHEVHDQVLEAQLQRRKGGATYPGVRTGSNVEPVAEHRFGENPRVNQVRVGEDLAQVPAVLSIRPVYHPSPSQIVSFPCTYVNYRIINS
jgi:hypothetical protein